MATSVSQYIISTAGNLPYYYLHILYTKPSKKVFIHVKSVNLEHLFHTLCYTYSVTCLLYLWELLRLTNFKIEHQGNYTNLGKKTLHKKSIEATTTLKVSNKKKPEKGCGYSSWRITIKSEVFR